MILEFTWATTHLRDNVQARIYTKQNLHTKKTQEYESSIPQYRTKISSNGYVSVWTFVGKTNAY